MMSFSRYLFEVLVGNKAKFQVSLKNHRLIYNEWRTQIASKKQPLDLQLPWLTIIAKKSIEQFLKSKAKEDVRVFEFGAGGSSLFFLQYAAHVTSVEHDKNWFDLVKRTVEEQRISGWDGNVVEPELIGDDIEKANLDASNPHHYYTTDDRSLGSTFKRYASFIDRFEDNYFDLVLVDGRSRPACLFHSLKKVKKGGMLVLDNAERKYYLENIPLDDFELICNSWGALICYNQFTQTNVYIKKN